MDRLWVGSVVGNSKGGRVVPVCLSGGGGYLCVSVRVCMFGVYADEQKPHCEAVRIV